MKTKNETFRTILAKAAVVAAIMIMAFVMLPQQVFAAPGKTVHVSNSAELKNALADTAVDTIIFKNDITAEVAMMIAPKRTNTNLVIDGNGYTFTERKTSAYDCTAGIKLIEATTIDTITIQNMNILGRNGYGTIYTCKKINQVFKDVTYTGPQMVYNDYGSVRIEDSTINIGQYNGNTYNGEVAEVNKVTLAGDVTITKTGNSCYEIFWLKNTGAGITVEDGANVNINNNKNTNACSGLIYASAAYDFNIGSNAAFSYMGKSYYEETCVLKNFNMGAKSEFNVKLDNKLTGKLIYASNAVNVGDSSAVNISIGGEVCGYVMYACKDMTIADNATVDIQTGTVASGYIMKSYSGNINVGDNAAVNINTGAVTCGYVVKAYCGSISIGKNADFVVNSNGVMKTNLMWVKRNLTVEEGALLDLIANKNTNICCNYVFYVDGCSEAYRSTITYNNPERVLFYNDNIASCTKVSYAAKLGNYTSINFNVYGTEYWNSAKTTGGVTALQNPDYKWIQKKSYNVTAAASCSASFNKGFSTSYDGAMDSGQYYFGKSTICCKAGSHYEVCLWNGRKVETEYTVRYLEKGTEKVLAPEKNVSGAIVGETVTEEAINIADYTLVSDISQELVLTENSADNVITFYYEKKTTTYTVRYLEEGTDAVLAPEKSVSGIVGETVTEAAINITDYTLISSTPQGLTLVENSTDNVITFYYKAKVNLIYDINCVYHDDYTGFRDTTQLYKCDQGVETEIDDLWEVFPNYTDKCTFMGWNTAADGSGIYYYDGGSLIMDSDTTLYAIWKSCVPTIDNVYEDDIHTAGTGVFGTGNVGASITVTFPNGTVATTLVESNGTWLIIIPPTALPLGVGETITTTQTESGKLVSDIVMTVIQ